MYRAKYFEDEYSEALDVMKPVAEKRGLYDGGGRVEVNDAS